MEGGGEGYVGNGYTYEPTYSAPNLFLLYVYVFFLLCVFLFLFVYDFLLSFARKHASPIEPPVSSQRMLGDCVL